MELNDLKEYLRIIVDLEKNVKMLDYTIPRIRDDADKLAIPNYIEKPVKRKSVEPELDESDVTVGIIMGIIGLIVLLFGIVVVCSSTQIGHGAGRALLLFLGVCAILIGGILMLNFSKHSDLRQERERCKLENQEIDSKFNDQVLSYENECKLDEIRVLNEDTVKHNLGLKVASLELQRHVCKSRLDKMYSLNIVYPKYRNFTMMCSIYEYINSGRCYTLDGPEGAYNILENEIRMDRVILQLDEALSKLDTIARNQFMLYQAVEENNRQQRLILESTDQILSCVRGMNSNIQKSTEELKASLESIDKNSALTAYAAERSQKELEYMNTMNYLESKYRGTGFNQPPSWRS